MKRCLALVGFPLAWGVVGCGLFTGPPPAIGGQYSLVRVNELDLPAFLHPLPDRITMLPTDCWYVLASGALGLTTESGSFAQNQLYVNSCTGSTLSNPAVSGTFTRKGHRLTFRVFRPGIGDYITFQGDVIADTIIVYADSSEQTLYFSKDPP